MWDSYNCVIVDVDIPWFSAFVLALKLSLSFGAVGVVLMAVVWMWNSIGAVR